MSCFDLNEFPVNMICLVKSEMKLNNVANNKCVLNVSTISLYYSSHHQIKDFNCLDSIGIPKRFPSRIKLT